MTSTTRSPAANASAKCWPATPLFPRVLVQMIASGEETGKLDYVLDRVSTHYDLEVDMALKTATSLIEPIMISVMASSSAASAWPCCCPSSP